MSFWADRKSTRLNSSHTEIYTLSLHDALPISHTYGPQKADDGTPAGQPYDHTTGELTVVAFDELLGRSEEHTSELQSHRDLHSFPTRRSSDLPHVWPPEGR